MELTNAARQRSLNAYYLLLEGSREGIPIYFFNRDTGAGRQIPLFFGDPLSTTRVPAGKPGYPNNRAFIANQQLAIFKSGAQAGFAPEVNAEEIVRAMMAERVNTMSYEAATPQVTQMLVDLLNRDVTPVVQSRGSPGEGDLPQMANVEATMVGAGDAYYHGARMSAAQALAEAGLRPLQKQPGQYEAPVAPFGADDAAVTSTNAFTMGQTALLDYDARHMLNWADLIYAMDLNGMNSSVTPISTPVQQSRPFSWLNFDAARVLNMIRGGYLFNIDQVSSTHVPERIIQDPESLRAMSQRNGSAWEAWSQLHHDLLIELNSSDHNPAVTPGYSPSSAPELNTPWFLQYYVKGGPEDAACVGGGVGPATGCQHGYIMSAANWDPMPVNNEIEALTNAIANMDVTDALVPQRFEETFFTVIDPSSVLTSSERTNAAPTADDYSLADLMAEIQTLQNPVPAQGNAIISTVEDLQAAGRLKVSKARLMVDDSLHLLGEDLLTASYWMNIRQIQGQQLRVPRTFGASPTAAWEAFRQVVPWQDSARPDVPPSTLAYDFLQANPAFRFYPPAANPPSGNETAAVSMRRLTGAIRAAKATTARFETAKARAEHAYLHTQAFTAEVVKKEH